MGNAAPRANLGSGQSQDPRLYLGHDLPKFIYSNQLGHGKFMKSYLTRVDGVLSVLKVYNRPPDEDLSGYAEKLSQLLLTLSPKDQPNVLPYQMWMQSTYRTGKAAPTPIYLGRQYLMANLYDRLATRPFLAEIEKKWVIYQLFRAVEMCHRKDVTHGDIKLENIMISSWNWLVLTDFAPYKPTYLPDDDPTDFHYYFDASDRRRCAIAPERFCAVTESHTTNAEPLSDLKQLDESPAGRVMDGPCLPSMDVFSLGCAIVEILLDGEVLLDLPGLLHYRANNFDRLDAPGSPVAAKMSRIENPTLREVLCHMTQKDPAQRKTVRQYREMLQEADYFPSYFGDLLYDLALRQHKEGVSPDDRVALLCKEYGASVFAMTGIEDEEGVEFFRRSLHGLDLHIRVDPPKNEAAEQLVADKPKPEKNLPSLQDVIAMSQSLLVQIEADIANIREHGKAEADFPQVATTAARMIQSARQAMFSSTNIIEPGVSFLQKVMTVTSGSSDAVDTSSRKSFEGPMLLVQMLCSAIRHVRFPQTKLIALHLLVRLGMLCNDTVLLQRVVPYIVELLEDQVASVRAIAARSLCAVVGVVQTFSALDAGLFPLYIFPAVSQLVKDPDDIVRVAFANSIASLAEASKRFLDRSQFISQTNALSEQTEENHGCGNGLHSTIIESPYDKQLRSLHDTVAKWIRELLSDGGPAQTARTSPSLVKRVLMRDMVRLCYFFGEENVEENLLQLLLTVLNDVDWELRRDFCAQIPSVCAFLGPTITAEFILPCIENALFDAEELVVAEAMRSLVSFVELELLPRQLILDNIKTSTPLLLHPRQSIREFAMQFVVAAAKFLGTADTYALLLPLLRPVLTFDLVGATLTIELLTSAVEEPISRKAYRRWLHEHASKQGLLMTDSISTESTNAGQNDDMIDMLGVVGFDSEEMPASSVGSNLLGGNSPSLQSAVSYSSTSETSAFPRSREKSVAAFRTQSRLISVATNNTSVSNYSTLDDNRKTEGLLDNDVRKFPIMRPYVEAVSREIHTKASTWSTAIRNTRMVRGRRVDNALDAVALSISESNAQSILVPNQRNAVIPSASDQSRALTHDLAAVTDVRELRKAYALTTTAADAARVALVDDPDQAEEIPLARAQSRKITPNDRLRRMESGDVNADESKFFNDDRVDARMQDPKALMKRLVALDVPPLPPDLGSLMHPDGRKFSIHLESVNTDSAVDLQSRAGWRPRQGVLAATFSEHSRAVNRLAVAPDQTFFVSASDDRTAKIWSLRGLESAVAPRSTLTYAMHKGRVLDACICENTHSVATCSDDGSVHVWRVDVEMDNYHAHRGQSTDGGYARNAGVSVIGTSVVKTIDAHEGAIVNVHHFNSDRASVLMYTTQRGNVHTWDLRSSTEPFQFQVRPELGYLTSMTMGHDRNWVCVGTSRGYIALYDIRYNVMSKLWQHSSRQPIHRLASSKTLPRGPKHTIPEDGSYLFVAAGNNEAVVWGIPGGGECIRCFRTTPLAESRGPPAALPVLEDIPLPAHPNSAIPQAMTSFLSDPVVKSFESANEAHSVRAIMGRITSSGSSYLVTAGTDKNIRFWDFHNTSKCYTISGLLPGQPKPAFETPRTDGLHDRLYTCYDATVPTPETTIASHLPQRQQRGPMPASTNHRDAVLDLKMVELPMKMMLSCSRDGEIKGWR